MERIGPYQVTGEIGRGGMGVVLRGVDPAMGRPVAIKVILLREFSDPQERETLRARLFREAHSAGILSHPGIVTIYFVGEEGDTAFIAMEYVDGPNLQTVLSRPQPPDRELLRRILRQTAAGLDYAHSRGVIHRDIKPANIMLDEKGAVKICDFGIAKGLMGQTSLTQVGTTVGSPFYMSPEQICGEEVGHAADQYSLAVVAYQMLTGQRPFEAATIQTLFFHIMSDPPRPAHEVNPALSPRVSEVLRKALAKEPASRYASCTEFAETLLASLEPARSNAPAPQVAKPAPPQSLPKTVLQRDVPPPQAAKSNRLLIGLLAAILVCAVLGGLGYMIWRLLRPAPVIETFLATETSVRAGETLSLQWSVRDARAVSISNVGQGLAPQGSRNVSPAMSTTYILRATGPGGSVTESLTVSVASPIVQTPLPPVIESFSASETAIRSGQSVNLQWRVHRAHDISILGVAQGLPAEGSRAVSPTASTTYILLANGPGGTVSRSVEIGVSSPPPPAAPAVESFSASRTALQSGQTAVLQWNVRGAPQVSIAGVGAALPSQGSRPVCPTVSKTYLLEAKGPGGTARASAQITVSIPPNTPVNGKMFRADPAMIHRGDWAVLRWDVDYASSVWIVPNIGPVDACGALRVQPQATQQYSLYYQNDRGTLHRSVRVTVR